MRLNKKYFGKPRASLTIVGICVLATFVKAADRSSLYLDITARLHPIGVSIMLTNPSGQQTGENLLSGLKLQDIPNSGTSHDGPGDDETGEPQAQSMAINVRRPEPGVYQMNVFAATSTVFYMGIINYDSARKRTLVKLQGTIAQGATQEFTVNYSPAPGAVPTIRPVLNTIPLNENSLASCGNISLSGHARAAGPVRSNGGVNVTGDAVINGDVTVAAVNTTGHAKVTGQIIQSPGNLNCLPSDLTAALQLLTTSNDNANIPAGFLKAGVLRLAGKNTLTLASGDYLVDRLELSGGSRLTANGSVRVFVRHGIELTGQAVAGTGASPLTIFSNSTGTLSLSGASELRAILYAPKAKINLSGQARIIGKVHVAAADMTGDSKVEAP